MKKAKFPLALETVSPHDMIMQAFAASSQRRKTNYCLHRDQFHVEVDAQLWRREALCVDEAKISSQCSSDYSRTLGEAKGKGRPSSHVCKKFPFPYIPYFPWFAFPSSPPPKQKNFFLGRIMIIRLVFDVLRDLWAPVLQSLCRRLMRTEIESSNSETRIMQSREITRRAVYSLFLFFWIARIFS
jgi:hypothetical protein